ncbi:MAG: DUF5689 domain-containing protein [Bacteroidales bacterium]|nr:DUF5689 domain-containing protein [Bacteroidales bacterium]
MKSKIFKLLFFISLIFAFGCARDFDIPPLDIPKATITANTTILELKQAFPDALEQVGVKPNGENYIIEGVVIGNDVEGNIYKNLMIQDSTAAITIGINSTDINSTYRIGQQIVINCTGLYVGLYNNLQQLGYETDDGTGITFMLSTLFAEKTQLNGLPAYPIDTIVGDIASLPTTFPALMTYQSQLFVFKDVYFQNGGVWLYTNSGKNTTRYIFDSEGNKLAVYNSSYSTFANDTLPSGTGNVVGILSYFKNSYQLLMRMSSDAYGFKVTD